MKAVVDAVWAVWSIGASIYDYIHTNAMEERIHALENVITIHQCVIGLLSAGVLVLFTYILFKKLWRCVKEWAGADMRDVGGLGSDTRVECGKANTDQTDNEEFYTLGTLDRLIRAGGYMETVGRKYHGTYSDRVVPRCLYKWSKHKVTIFKKTFLTSLQCHLFPKSVLGKTLRYMSSISNVVVVGSEHAGLQGPPVF